MPLVLLLTELTSFPYDRYQVSDCGYDFALCDDVCRVSVHGRPSLVSYFSTFVAFYPLHNRPVWTVSEKESGC